VRVKKAEVSKWENSVTNARFIAILEVFNSLGAIVILKTTW